ncbi:hypothetical protein EIN_410990 [Entamoeba invadens IP1]|uniref:Cyclin N-terminal domain-containing protein n=1 Tax=Entamoeba invadens IP1 TaxID=370355 RepID=A0A0A1U4F7_ENTIV|nr:hypothetical protein EIN_410990 [Entamoeba invadens IP1]ELP87746.1 hypothetical protein EIN_410990 [Entamoeba invadens IP1]|eukprot:XP_004254517.1 hypothetical protein EIN_410990 [Entamoeba invadens IP1]
MTEQRKHTKKHNRSDETSTSAVQEPFSLPQHFEVFQACEKCNKVIDNNILFFQAKSSDYVDFGLEGPPKVMEDIVLFDTRKGEADDMFDERIAVMYQQQKEEAIVRNDNVRTITPDIRDKAVEMISRFCDVEHTFVLPQAVALFDRFALTHPTFSLSNVMQLAQTVFALVVKMDHNCEPYYIEFRTTYTKKEIEMFENNFLKEVRFKVAYITCHEFVMEFMKIFPITTLDYGKIITQIHFYMRCVCCCYRFMYVVPSVMAKALIIAFFTLRESKSNLILIVDGISALGDQTEKHDVLALVKIMLNMFPQWAKLDQTSIFIV